LFEHFFPSANSMCPIVLSKFTISWLS